MKWEELNNFSKTSDCNKHKFVTAIEWNADAPGIVLIGLNPSKKDGMKSPSIKKIISILDNHGYGSFCLGNLFSSRSIKPENLSNHEDATSYLKKMMTLDADILLMYGNTTYRDRARWLNHILPVDRNIYCLGKTKQGHPKHPLMLRKTTKLEKYETTSF